LTKLLYDEDEQNTISIKILEYATERNMIDRLSINYPEAIQSLQEAKTRSQREQSQSGGDTER
jgi:hypothetical protein